MSCNRSRNGLARSGFQSIVGHDIYAAAQQVLEVFQQAAQVEQGTPWLGLDQQVHIAGLRGLTACHRAKDPHVAGAVSLRQSQNIRAACHKGLQRFIDPTFTTPRYR